MIKPVLKSILPPSFIAAFLFIDRNELITLSGPVTLILIGVVLIGIGNIARKRLRRVK